MSFSQKRDALSRRNIWRACSLLACLDVACAAVTPPPLAPLPNAPFDPPSRADSAPSLPGAEHSKQTPVADGPLIEVSDGIIRVDGKVIAETRSIDEAPSPVRIEPLWSALREWRQLWVGKHPDEPFPGIVSFAIDRATPAYVVKGVFHTAALSGFPNGEFMVAGGGHFAVAAEIPPAPQSPPAEGHSQIGDGLPPEVIQRVVRQNFGLFRPCYEPGVSHQLGLHEMVRVRFVIENDGHVSVATAISISGSAEAVPCVLKTFLTLKFPAFKGSKVAVVYPVTLAR